MLDVALEEQAHAIENHLGGWSQSAMVAMGRLRMLSKKSGRRIRRGHEVQAIAVLVYFVLIGCKDESRRAGGMGGSDATAGPDMGTEQQTMINVDSLPDIPGPYRYYNGVLCCAEGEGDACCEGYEHTCDESGGPYQRCLEAGEKSEWKLPCVRCCPGLERGVVAMIGTDGKCVPGPPSVQVCFLCGDGVCTESEECHCPTDCARD